MKNKKIILLILGAFLMLVPFVINDFNPLRLIINILGIIIFTIFVVLHRKHSYLKGILISVFLIVGCFFLDYVNFKYLNIIPMYSYKIQSSSKVSTYNSFFYRVYDCNEKLFLDENYSKNYMCKSDDIKTISINKYLENPKASYKKTKGKYIHLIGKINTIIGDSSLYLNDYDEAGDQLNGYVEFSENKKVIVEGLKLDVNKFYIYDYIEVIGEVKSLIEKDDAIEIHLINSKIINDKAYDSYELVVNDIPSKEKKLIIDKIYFCGISGIFYKYDENNTYELTYLLKDKRETLENLLERSEKEDISDDIKLYKNDKYNIVTCKNEDVIFTSKDITNVKKLCE